MNDINNTPRNVNRIVPLIPEEKPKPAIKRPAEETNNNTNANDENNANNDNQFVIPENSNKRVMLKK